MLLFAAAWSLKDRRPGSHCRPLPLQVYKRKNILATNTPEFLCKCGASAPGLSGGFRLRGKIPPCLSIRYGDKILHR